MNASHVRSPSRTASDLTGYLVSMCFVVIAIERTSVGCLSNLNIYDLDDDKRSRTESFQVVGSNMYGENIKLEWEGANARSVHRIFMAAFELSNDDVLPFRIHGGLKGGHADGTSEVAAFGNCSCSYKAIHSNDEDVVIRIVCQRDLEQDELPYPMSNKDAEEYASEEHKVELPIANWPKSNAQLSMRIGEFLVCRSPGLIPLMNCHRRNANVTDAPVDDLAPTNLFNIY